MSRLLGVTSRLHRTLLIDSEVSADVISQLMCKASMPKLPARNIPLAPDGKYGPARTAAAPAADHHYDTPELHRLPESNVSPQDSKLLPHVYGLSVPALVKMADHESPPHTFFHGQANSSPPAARTEPESQPYQAQGSASCEGVPIRLQINSPGGMPLSCLAIYDVLTRLKKQVAIATCCFGEAHGMASLLLTAGTAGFRYSGAHSLISLRVPAPQRGTYRSGRMVYAGQQLHVVNSTISEIYQNNCEPKFTLKGNDRRKEKFANELQKKRFKIFTANEARYYGLIDHVLPHS